MFDLLIKIKLFGWCFFAVRVRFFAFGVHKHCVCVRK